MMPNLASQKQIAQAGEQKIFRFRHKISGIEVPIPAIDLATAKYYLFVGLHRDWNPEDVEVIKPRLFSAARLTLSVE